MNNYCVFDVYYADGSYYGSRAANFISRGIKHSQKILDTYCEAYMQGKYPLDLVVNFQVYFHTTNPNFAPNQLRVYRGKVNGATTHQLATKDELKTVWREK